MKFGNYMPDTYAAASSAKTPPAASLNGNDPGEKAAENRETRPPIARRKLLGLAIGFPLVLTLPHR